MTESSSSLRGATISAAVPANFSKSAGEEDHTGSPDARVAVVVPPLRSAGAWTRSSIYCATLSWARRIRSLPVTNCCITGSTRWRQASLWRAASIELRRITSQPGQPEVSPAFSKSDLRSCVCRGARKAGSSWKAGGSKGTGSAFTGARIPMRASPGWRVLGWSSEAIVARIVGLHLFDGGRRRTERPLTKPVGVRISDSALPSARRT